MVPPDPVAPLVLAAPQVLAAPPAPVDLLAPLASVVLLDLLDPLVNVDSRALQVSMELSVLLDLLVLLALSDPLAPKVLLVSWVLVALMALDSNALLPLQLGQYIYQPQLRPLTPLLQALLPVRQVFC